MREILFRAKRLDNGEWTEGDLVRAYGNRTFIFPYEDRHLPNWCVDIIAEVDPKTVGQFIDEWDTNGVKMFEGDIVRVYDRKPVHESDIPRGEALIIADNSCLINLDGLGRCRPQDTVRVEVIGNIYDNSELLSDKAKRWLDNYYFPDYEGEPYGKWS